MIFFKKNVLFFLGLLFALPFGAKGQLTADLWKGGQEPAGISGRSRTEANTGIYVLDSKVLDPDFNLLGVFHLPTPEGEMLAFRLEPDPVMAEDLMRKFPEIATYRGTALENNGYQVIVDRTPQGLYAVVDRGAAGAYYVDPLPGAGGTRYRIYRRAAWPASGAHDCAFADAPILRGRSGAGSGKVEGELRTYRLAVAATGNYTRFHGGTKAGALGAIVTTIHRINRIYQRDVGVRLELISRNDTIIFTDPDLDPFSSTGRFIEENLAVLRDYIGEANYDIGHVFHAGEGGGSAFPGVVCRDGLKGAGYTALIAPVGDPYDVDFVAHEIGHQFGALHTFNGIDGSCSGARSGAFAFEPGSGSTIMAYAGLCGLDNLQSNSDDYFHSSSIEEMRFYITRGEGKSCPVIDSVRNRAPAIAVSGNGLVIPVGTPFELEASATDPETGSLEYTWEEFDLGPAQSLGAASGNSPLFRSFAPGPFPRRTFPRLSLLLTGRSDPAELLPAYSRELNFRLTARDNHTPSGGVAWEEVWLEVYGGAGPFLCNSHLPGYWAHGRLIELRWDVAATDLPPVGADSVEVWLSVDGGAHFDMRLAGPIANDGRAWLKVPADLEGDQCRLKIKPVGNVFFAIHPATFSAGPALAQGLDLGLESDGKAFCAPDSIPVRAYLAGYGGWSGSVQLTDLSEGALQVNAPAGAVNAQDTVLLWITGGDRVESGRYVVRLAAEGPDFRDTAFLELEIFSGPPGDLTAIAPRPEGEEVSILPVFTWSGNPSARTYRFELADNEVFSDPIVSVAGLQETRLELAFQLDPETRYFWRVRGENAVCGASGFSGPFSFRTESLICETYSPEVLPAPFDNLPFIRPVLTVDREVVVKDVNLTLAGEYPASEELIFKLQSPGGPIIDLLLAQETCDSTNAFFFVLDDEAPAGPPPCPNTVGARIQPETPLSRFDGSSAAGRWTLYIFDKGSDGQLTDWQLEICYGSSEVISSTKQPWSAVEPVGIFPNPCRERCYLRLATDSTADLQLYDLTGRLVLSRRIAPLLGNYELELSGLQAGPYLLKAVDQEGKLFSGRLLVAP